MMRKSRNKKKRTNDKLSYLYLIEDFWLREAVALRSWWSFRCKLRQIRYLTKRNRWPKDQTDEWHLHFPSANCLFLDGNSPDSKFVVMSEQQQIWVPIWIFTWVRMTPNMSNNRDIHLWIVNIWLSRILAKNAVVNIFVWYVTCTTIRSTIKNGIILLLII